MDKRDKKIQSGRKVDWFLFVLIVIVGYFSWTLVNQQVHLNAVNDSCEAAQVRLEEARQANEELRQERDQLEDPAYIEKVAREELGMTRKGEMPYISANSRR